MVSDVAITITGLLRSLLSQPVAASFREYVMLPLGSRLDIFVALVVADVTKAQNLTEELAAVFGARTRAVMVDSHTATAWSPRCPVLGTRVDWGSADARNSSTRLRPINRDLPSLVEHAKRVLVQWIAIRAAYLAIEQAEEQRGGVRYAWIVRTRTDIVYLEDFASKWLFTSNNQFVYVPEGGMNAFDVAMCQNDHLFCCPRSLCRPYFHLLELWESPHCRHVSQQASNVSPGREKADALKSIFAVPSDSAPGNFTVSGSNGHPTAPFALPPLPALADAEWYFLARYSSGHLCDAASTTAASCCGLVREVPYLYSLARGDDRRGNIECERRLVDFWRGKNATELHGRHRDALDRCHRMSHRYQNCGGRHCR